MLTAAAATVKCDLSSTPEHRAGSRNSDEGLKSFRLLVERIEHAATQHQPIHQVEETLVRDLLVLGRWMLRAFWDRAGTGDVGPTLTVGGDPPADPDPELPRRDQPHKRPYLALFGEVPIERTCYGHDRVEAAPLDAPLPRPQRPYSYLLQQWLARVYHVEIIKLSHNETNLLITGLPGKG